MPSKVGLTRKLGDNYKKTFPAYTSRKRHLHIVLKETKAYKNISLVCTRITFRFVHRFTLANPTVQRKFVGRTSTHLFHRLGQTRLIAYLNKIASVIIIITSFFLYTVPLLSIPLARASRHRSTSVHRRWNNFPTGVEAE